MRRPFIETKWVGGQRHMESAEVGERLGDRSPFPIEVPTPMTRVWDVGMNSVPAQVFATARSRLEKETAFQSENWVSVLEFGGRHTASYLFEAASTSWGIGIRRQMNLALESSTAQVGDRTSSN